MKNCLTFSDTYPLHDAKEYKLTLINKVEHYVYAHKFLKFRKALVL